MRAKVAQAEQAPVVLAPDQQRNAEERGQRRIAPVQTLATQGRVPLSEDQLRRRAFAARRNSPLADLHQFIALQRLASGADWLHASHMQQSIVCLPYHWCWKTDRVQLKRPADRLVHLKPNATHAATPPFDPPHGAGPLAALLLLL